MKFNCSVTIDLPREKVIPLWDNSDNLSQWQDGFRAFEHLSGTPGEVGAKSRMVYDMRGSDMELIETITENRLPESFTGLYYHKHMTNTMHNTFRELSPNQTEWRAEIEYTELRGFMIKVMAKLFPGMFKKQTQKWLNQFKDFAERTGER